MPEPTSFNHFTKKDVHEMLNRLKEEFDKEMSGASPVTNKVLDLCKAMNTAAGMLHFKIG